MHVFEVTKGKLNEKTNYQMTPKANHSDLIPFSYVYKTVSSHRLHHIILLSSLSLVPAAIAVRWGPTAAPPLICPHPHWGWKWLYGWMARVSTRTSFAHKFSLCESIAIKHCIGMAVSFVHCLINQKWRVRLTSRIWRHHCELVITSQKSFALSLVSRVFFNLFLIMQHWMVYCYVLWARHINVLTPKCTALGHNGSKIRRKNIDFSEQVKW